MRIFPGLALVLAGAALAVVATAVAQDAPAPATPEPPTSGPADEAPPPVRPMSWSKSLPDLSAAGRLAYLVLADAQRFTDGAIYEGGMTPPEVEALRVLHREEKGGEAFLALCRNGNAAGRLWGLCGLWYGDRARFDSQLAAVLEDCGSEEVEVQRGCCGGSERVRDIIRLPAGVREGGTVAVELSGPSETCRDWFARHPADVRAQYDIAGGGWPCVLRSGGGW